MDADQALEHRLEALAFVIRKVGKAELQAREQLRVLADEIVGEIPGLIVERIVGGAHIRKLGIAASGRDSYRAQQRIPGGHDFERAVRVPQAVTDREESAAVVVRHYLLVLVEVGDVGEHGRQTVFVRLAQAITAGVLEFAESAAEGQVLLVGEILIVEDEHGMRIHRGVDGGHVLGRDGVAQIQAVDFGGEALTNLLGGERHDKLLWTGWRSYTCFW